MRRATTAKAIKSIEGVISIHALREEGDAKGTIVNSDLTISIHALREEGDIQPYEFGHHARNFNPRPP